MKINSNFTDISSDEARLLRAGICSFDSASSGVSHEELAECADVPMR